MIRVYETILEDDQLISLLPCIINLISGKGYPNPDEEELLSSKKIIIFHKDSWEMGLEYSKYFSKPRSVKKKLYFDKVIECPFGDDKMIYDITISFYKLFVLVHGDGIKSLRLADYNEWYNTTRCLLVQDKRTRDDIARVYRHLRDSSDKFWVNTISSMAGVRKHFDKILIKSKAESNKVKEANKESAPYSKPIDIIK